jgi:hypothetical protein
MRNILSTALTGCLALVLTGSVRAADADVRALIDKGVKARGGEANLAKFPANTWKGKGKFYGMGADGIEFSGEWSSVAPLRARGEIDFEVNGMKVRFVRVLNGDMGWSKAGDEVEAMDADTLAEEKADTYATWVTSLLPLLKDKAFQLAPLGESKVGDRTAVGVKVSRKDHRDVSLFFDKENGLLLKSEFRRKDVMGGNEFTQENLFKDYKETEGIQRARKVTINRDGRRFIELEVVEFKPLEKLDESLFGKP